jgi:subtilisin family serine protease
VAIWDTGVDVSVFPERLHANPKERLDGEDTDGNGFIDDLHGVAYDLHWNKTPDLLYPLGDAEHRRDELLAKVKGYFDLQASIDSPEAAALKQDVAKLDPQDVTPYFEDLGRCAIWVHGTHVAGIVAEGNPSVRISVARLTADYRAVPEPPTVEDARKGARAFKETVDYFKSRGVRVVNMSWGINFKSFERDLELNGIGKDGKERAEMAREMFGILKKGLHEAIQSASEILFVAGAGNEDADVTFDEFIPASFDLPNVLSVGAVDQAGEPTSFTNIGDEVDVYANGFEVESFVPGGGRMAFSGTSMSSPNAANLAAKLIALKPSLTPEQVVDMIFRGCDKVGDERPILLINPRRSIELLGV